MAEFIEKTDTLNQGRVKLNSAIKDAEDAKNISVEADEKATQALANSESTQTQLDTIVIEGDSSVEAAQARVDEKGEAHPTLKARIDDGFTEVTSQLAQKVNERDARIINGGLEGVGLGDNLALSSGWVTTGWSGSISNGYTNTLNNERPLIIPFTPQGNGHYYIQFVATDVGKQQGGTDDLFIQIGDSPQFKTYKGTFDVRDYEYGLYYNSNTPAEIIITPHPNWTGTITDVRIRKMTADADASVEYLDKSENLSSELRISESSLGNNFLGYKSGKRAIGDNNVGIGSYALENVTTGFWNTAVGTDALRRATVASRNIALGIHALMDNEYGDRNISIGTFSMRRNITGYSNIAIGADSLWYNTSGYHNIAIGQLALDKNTTGHHNIGIGEGAIGAGETGQYNIGIGYRATRYAESERNIGIGYEAVHRTSTGTGNTGIGHMALRYSQNGDYHIAIGEETMSLSNGGRDNIALGRKALQEARGSHNVAIGRFALQKNVKDDSIAIGVESLSTNELGDRNIAIGYRSQWQAKGSNNLSIGRLALSVVESDFNIAIGREASTAIVTGEYNIALGDRTMHHNKNGSSNIAIGERSLNYNIDGNNNVAVGQRAGYESLGSNNTFLGHRAGVHLKGSNNIMIGHEVGGTDSQVSNQINIGDTIKGDILTKVVTLEKLQLTNLPTTNPNVSGQLWNDNGTIKISG